CSPRHGYGRSVPHSSRLEPQGITGECGMGTLKRKVGAIMGSALLVGGLLAGPPASAAQLSGEESCPGQFGYLTATTVGTTRLVSPGSVYTWAYMTGGTRTRIATWWNGESKS